MLPSSDKSSITNLIHKKQKKIWLWTLARIPCYYYSQSSNSNIFIQIRDFKPYLIITNIVQFVKPYITLKCNLSVT